MNYEAPSLASSENSLGGIKLLVKKTLKLQ